MLKDAVIVGIDGTAFGTLGGACTKWIAAVAANLATRRDDVSFAKEDSRHREKKEAGEECDGGQHRAGELGSELSGHNG